MKKLALIVCLLVVLTVSQACTTMIIHPVKPRNHIRFGPVQLKVDDEWVIAKDDVKFIRIGFKKRGMYDIHFEYEDLSPKILAISTSESMIKLENGSNRDSFEMVYYDIPVGQTELWVDLYLMLLNSYEEVDNEIISNLMSGQGFFIYHPHRKKWWGYYYFICSEIIMSEELYDQKLNTYQEYQEYSNNFRNNPDYGNLYLETIGKRVFRIPSIKIYEENLSVLVKELRWFKWYVEKQDLKTESVND